MRKKEGTWSIINSDTTLKWINTPDTTIYSIKKLDSTRLVLRDYNHKEGTQKALLEITYKLK